MEFRQLLLLTLTVLYILYVSQYEKSWNLKTIVHKLAA